MSDTERIAKDKWNKEADAFNQWDALGQDEKDALINQLPTTEGEIK